MFLSNGHNKIALVAGTRPEIIKLYPIMRILDEEKIEYDFIFTGQHYSFNLSMNFIKELKIKTPNYFGALDNPIDPLSQFSDLIIDTGRILKTLKPTSIMVVGDTNSVLSSALAASKLKIPIIHVEAGLRSYDWNMQEEYNRKITDSISDVLLAPTSESAFTLEREQVQGAIFTVGNTVIDSIRLCMEMSPEKPLLSEKEDYFNDRTHIDDTNGHILLTLHREENVNDPIKLKRIFDVLSEFDIHCIFPIHPHTLKNLHKFGINYVGKNIEVIDPAGYLHFLKLMKTSRFVITDSGGIQEEITSPYINKRAVVLRNSTERYESVSSGHAILCNVEYQEMKEAISSILGSPSIPQLRHSISPYGDGHAAEKIVKILKEEPIVPLPDRVLTKKISNSIPHYTK